MIRRIKFACAALILSMFTTTAHADCLACSSLKKIRLTLKTGETAEGYMQWNDAWNLSTPHRTCINPTFPKGVFTCLSKSHPEYIFTLHRTIIINPAISAQATFFPKGDEQKIPISKIQKMESIPGKYENKDATALQPLSPTQAALMQKPVIAKFCIDDSTYERCFISYNPDDTEQKLQKLAHTNSLDKNQRQQLEDQNILCFDLSYD